MRKLLFVLPAIFLSSTARSEKFYINDPLKRDVVHFHMQAPLEDIVGYSHEISGMLDINPKELTKSAGGSIKMVAKSLESGMKLRDRQMHDIYLEVAKFPEVQFEVKSIAPVFEFANHIERDEKMKKHNVLNDQQTQRVKLSGVLTLHGVKKNYDLFAELTYYKESRHTLPKFNGDLIHLKTSFDVHLRDHLIFPPEIIAMQVAELIHIHSSMTGSTAKTKRAKTPEELMPTPETPGATAPQEEKK